MGFFRDLEDDIKELGRDIDDNIFQPIKENPIGAIVSVGGMALGIPPIYAGALGGAANAAANDGDILKGALVGGLTGYAGGAGASAAAGAGAGTVLSSAAGGAAAGAAGAALTGGDILKGGLVGGLMGGVTGYVKSEYFNDAGGKTYTYDDGSTLSVDSKGNPIGYTNATDGTGAPVYEYNSNTGKIEAVGSEPSRSVQALNELTVEQTQDLINRNVDPGMIDNLTDTGTGGEQPFRVEVRGTPATIDNPGSAIEQYRTPGTALASWDQIDAGLAGWNPAANSWEVMPSFNGSEIYTFDDGSTISIGRDGATSYTDSFDNTYNAGGGEAYSSGEGSTTYRFDDGSWFTLNADGSSVVADVNGRVTTHAGGTYSGAGTNGATTDLGELVITAPRIPKDIADMGTIEITAPRLPGVPVTIPPGTTPPTPGVTPETPPPAGTTPATPGGVAPVTPVFPIITPSTPTPGGGGGGYTPTPGGPIQAINLPGGLNPGFMDPTPFYNTFNDAQSQFSWGQRAFQPGPTFDPTLYNQAYAPQTPWGAQQMAQPLTPEQFARAAQGLPVAQTPDPVAQRAVAYRAATQPMRTYAESAGANRPFPVAQTAPARPPTPAPAPAPAPAPTPFVAGPTTPNPVVVGPTAPSAPAQFVVGPTAPSQTVVGPGPVQPVAGYVSPPAATPAPAATPPVQFVAGPTAPVALPAGTGNAPINNLQLAGSLDQSNQVWDFSKFSGGSLAPDYLGLMGLR